MKVFHKALIVATLCISMLLGMTACGKEALDGSQVVATVGEKEMTLGEVNFLLRYQQVQTESYYESMFGEGIYAMDLYGDGSTFGASFKEDVMEQMQEYYILEEKSADYGISISSEEKAAIEAAATAFLSANDDYAKEQMTADQATVEKVLTLMTIRSKMVGAVSAEADVTVTDEEAAQRGFSYVSVYKGTEDDAMSEDEIKESKDKLNALIESVKGGNSIDAAAVEQGMTAYPGNYGEGTEVYYDADMIAAMKEIKEGEVTGIIETETDLFVAQVTADLDEEATATRKESLVTTKQNDYMTEIMETWKTDYPLVVVNTVWDEVVFDRSYVIKPE